MFFNILVYNIFFCGSVGGLARRRIFEFLDPFSNWFLSFFDIRNTGLYNIFLFSVCWTTSFKTSKNLVNYAILCYDVNKNIVNTSIFWFWLKKHCKLQCLMFFLGHLILKNHGICSDFCFLPRKNTVNNSNFAVFFMIFIIFWIALVRYIWLSNFRMFLISMADIIGNYERSRRYENNIARPYRGSCRGATAIKQNNGDRREQWLTSLRVWIVHSICTYMIFIYI